MVEDVKSASSDKGKGTGQTDPKMTEADKKVEPVKPEPPAPDKTADKKDALGLSSVVIDLSVALSLIHI